eukprot:CAMPEP_0194746272 /NCGR_PEP_ID=MMETSP0323_2-20130528/161_1 /TAXON_ID=2866 ORGANISM="Crypthecodinium cohnii, Strain Seligo" /NCGR_SAMPLE_ID=MMETSP0323_2 /ASSEMBLY_ACC=CAM_ASM_000346 /LENGTH=86 /DNA_ID=CAMNT_0039658637 /DNA_START=88 /DNA_END=348 /DNA_ORIENTATION=+
MAPFPSGRRMSPMMRDVPKGDTEAVSLCKVKSGQKQPANVQSHSRTLRVMLMSLTAFDAGISMQPLRDTMRACSNNTSMDPTLLLM